MPRPQSIPRRLLTMVGLLLLALVGAVVAGCGSDEATADGATSTGPATPVSIALDWTPNTNHIGVFVARQKGWYADEGIDLTVLPYAQTPPETLISSGKADFGFTYQAGIAYARASGKDVKQVFANVAKTQYAIGVRADRDDIRSPKDLDGKTYAGFGTPDEGPELKYVITKDGGAGTFRSVALSTSAYDAVYNGRADFTISVSTWDGIEATLIGKPLRYFEFTDYGFPTQYSSAIASSDRFLSANADVATRFLAATRRGYEFARDNPAEAADLLVAANPQALKNTALVTKSAETLAAKGYYGDGALGEVSGEVWDAYGGFLFDNKLLAGDDGKPLATRPDFAQYWTNDYLPD